MKKSLLKKIAKVSLGLFAFSGIALAEDKATANSVGGNVDTILTQSSFIIKSGAVLAALWGGYKVLLSDGATGVHWFMLIVGGAVAAGYNTIKGVIVGFFNYTPGE